MNCARIVICTAALIALSAQCANAAPALATNNVNMRQGPGTDFPVITTIPGGSTVDITGCRGEWCTVVWQAKAVTRLQRASTRATGRRPVPAVRLRVREVRHRRGPRAFRRPELQVRRHREARRRQATRSPVLAVRHPVTRRREVCRPQATPLTGRLGFHRRARRHRDTRRRPAITRPGIITRRAMALITVPIGDARIGEATDASP